MKNKHLEMNILHYNVILHMPVRYNYLTILNHTLNKYRVQYIQLCNGSLCILECYK